MTSSKRALTALATGALALPFIIAPAAYAVAPEPPAFQSVDDLCADVPADFNPFTDDDGTTFEDEIECIAYAGIALGNPRGIGTDKYGPSFTVNRDAMASFIARMIDAADNLDTGDNIQALPSSSNTEFTDIAGNVHAANINRLAAANIVLGGPGGAPRTIYGPSQQVTRAQMASFINRAVAYMQGEDPATAGGASGYATTNDYFTDDEAFSSNHEPNINGIASEGIAVGDGVDTYRPTAFIQRDQMAGFIARTLATFEERGEISPVTEDAANTPPGQNEATVTAGDVEDGSFPLGVQGDDIESITVTGDCITEQTFTPADDEDTDASDNLYGFTVVLNDDAEAGDCVITVVTTFTAESGLDDETDTITVEVPEGTPNPNDSISVEPDEAAILSPVVVNPDTTDADNRSFTATGLNNAETYRITLLPCDNVTRSEDGDAQFEFSGLAADVESDGDNLAAAGGTQADIISVNGNPQGTNFAAEPGGTAANAQGGAETATGTPVNGSLTFTIDGNAPECVVPVVYLDGGTGQTNAQGGSNSRLEVDENGEPVEAFGLGGETTFEPAEAATGTVGADQLIVRTDEANDRFITNTAVFEYDANDRFFVSRGADNNTAEPEEQVTLEEFEALLSVGDEISQGTIYQQNEAFQSTFILENLTPTPPTAGAASNTTDTTTTLTFTNISSEATAVTVYCEVQPTTVGAPDVVVTQADPVCATGTTDADATTAGFQVVVTGLTPATTYDFAASQTVEDEESGLSGEIENVLTRPGPVDRPTIVDADLVNDAVIEGRATNGDVIELVFSEGVTLAADATFSFTDADGDTVLFDCNETADNPAPGTPQNGVTSATCAFGSDAEAGDDVDFDEVRITLTEDAEDRNAAGNGTIDYPLTITAVTGVTDRDGDAATVDITNSTDKTVEDEPEA